MAWLPALSSLDLARGLAQVGLGVGLSAAVYGLTSFHFRSLTAYFFRPPSRDGYKLDFAPSEISWADRAFLLTFGVLNKALLGLFHSGLKTNGKETVQLPRLDIRCPVTVSKEQQDIYSAAVTLGAEPEAGTTRSAAKSDGLAQSFLLAALTSQLMLLLVVHPRLPVAPLGAVNVRNRIEFHQQPVEMDGVLSAHAHVGGGDSLGRITRRGVEFDIHIDVAHAQSNTLVLRQTITILAPCKTTPSPPPSSTSSSQPHTSPSKEGQEDFETIASIHMTTSAPSMWIKVCGDFNPIHVSSTLARLFGFRGKIAHGNHVVANMLAAVSCRPNAAAVQLTGPWFVLMDFKRPMVLPIRLVAQTTTLAASPAPVQRQWRCVGETDAKVYVTGSIGQL